MRRTSLRLLALLAGINLLTPVLPAQTITIEGYLRDSLGQPVDFANVYATRQADSSDIVAFVLSDAEGYYSLRVPPHPGQDHLFLKAGKLSYETVTMAVPLPEKGTSERIKQDLVLYGKTFSFREVVVASEAPPVLVRKDTIIFQADAFADGREAVVEDLLKKLPGVTVGANGQVTVNGQAIDKVLVENDDLFGEGYSLLTKNLSADLVDKVEVWQRYSDDPLMKGIEPSDKVVLNLQLKKERKSALFGNAELGYGASSFYENRVNLLSFLGKSRFILLGNINNTGQDPGSELPESDPSPGGSPDEDQPARARSLLTMDQDWPDLKKERYNRNNAEFSTLNVILSPGKTLKIKSLIGLRFDDFNFRQNRIQVFPVQNVRLEESTRYFRNDRGYFYHLDAAFTPGPTTRLDYFGAGKHHQMVTRRNTLFNRQPFQEELGQEVDGFTHRLRFTKKITDQQVVQISATLSNERIPQRLQLDRFAFPDLLVPREDDRTVGQTAGHRVAAQSLAAHLVRNVNGNMLRIGVDYSGATEALRSDLAFLLPGKAAENAGEAYGNHLTQRQDDLFAALDYQRTVSPRLSLSGRLEGHMLFNNQVSEKGANGARTEEIRKNERHYLLPRVRIKWTPTDKHTLLLAYQRGVRNLALPDAYSGFILTDYRSFSRGTGRFAQLPSNVLILHYAYGGWAKKVLLNSNIILVNDEWYAGSNYRITPENSTVARILLRRRNLQSVNATLDRFLDVLSGNLKLTGGISRASFRNVLNDSLPRNVRSNAFFFGWAFRSAFPGWFNLHLGTDWTGTAVRQPLRQHNWTMRSFLDMAFRFSLDFSLEFNNDAYWFPRDNQGNALFFFSDFGIRYTVKRNALTFQLSGKNLFNTTTFSTYDVNDIRQADTAISLMPRYVLLKVNFRFPCP